MVSELASYGSSPGEANTNWRTWVYHIILNFGWMNKYNVYSSKMIFYIYYLKPENTIFVHKFMNLYTNMSLPANQLIYKSPLQTPHLQHQSETLLQTPLI